MAINPTKCTSKYHYTIEILFQEPYSVHRPISLCLWRLTFEVIIFALVAS